MIPRYGEPVEPGRRYTRRPGAYAILPRGSDVLLTRQSQPKDEIQLPGGGIDPGESPVSALYREVFEETGWRIARPRRLGAFRRFVFMPEYDLWAEKVCVIYLAFPVRPHGPPSEPHHSVVWAEARSALGLLENAGDRAFLRRWISSR